MSEKAQQLSDLGSYYNHKSVKNKDNLSWRLDPDQSYSDWTIIVKVAAASHEGDSNDESSSGHSNAVVKRDATTYHVHKNQLGVGKRYSEYFSSVFNNSTLIESKNSTSEIELPDSAADAIPALLDFLYSSNDSIKATTQSAVALRYLSNYFGIAALFDDVNAFIKNDLVAATAPVYLAEGVSYGDDIIVNNALILCARYFTDIDMELLLQLPPHLFESIIISAELKCKSYILSARVAEYCRVHPDAVNPEFLGSITDPEKMPSIEPGSALFLLNLGRDNFVDNDMSLHKRCLKAASSSWKDLFINAPHQDSSTAAATTSMIPAPDYINIPLQEKVELLELALQTAIEEIKLLEVELDDQYQMNFNLNEKIKRESKKSEKYASELSKFARLDFKTLKERGVTYDSHGRTGDMMPNFPPEQHPVRRDGVVIRVKISTAGSNTRTCSKMVQCPVFYYIGR